jgi:hypothetical protein
MPAAGLTSISFLRAAFRKYAYESVDPEEARRAVSKGGRDSGLPKKYVAILMKRST